MGAMSIDDRHTDRVERRATSGDEDESTREADFEAALAERYRRLSLLTLDLAEEAGEAAVNFSLVDTKGVRPAFFDRRLAAMTRAIWAHRVIERLRREGGLTKKRGGAPAPAAKAVYGNDGAKAATLRSDAKDWCDDAGGAQPMQPFPDEKWTPRSSREESGLVGGGVERTGSVCGDQPGADEAALIASINDDGRRPGAVIDALAEGDLAADDFGARNPSPTRHGPAAKAANGRNSAKAAFLRESAPARAGMASMSRCGDVNRKASNLSPTRHGLTMASMSASGEDAADETQSKEPRLVDRWTPRSSRGESEIVATGAVEQTTGNKTPTRHGLTMASMSRPGESDACNAQSSEFDSDDRWTPRSSRGESEIVLGGAARRNIGVRGDHPGADEALLIDSIDDDGHGLGAVIDALADDDLAADDFDARNPSPTRHGLTMASMAPRGDFASCFAKPIERNSDERWTPRPRANARFFKVRPPSRPGRGESEILEAGVAERDVGVRGDTSDNNKPARGAVFGRRRFFSPP